MVCVTLSKCKCGYFTIIKIEWILLCAFLVIIISNKRVLQTFFILLLFCILFYTAFMFLYLWDKSLIHTDHHHCCHPPEWALWANELVCYWQLNGLSVGSLTAPHWRRWRWWRSGGGLLGSWHFCICTEIHKHVILSEINSFQCMTLHAPHLLHYCFRNHATYWLADFLSDKGWKAKSCTASYSAIITWDFFLHIWSVCRR